MKKFFATTINGYIGILFPLIVTIILLEKLHHIISPLVHSIEARLHISRLLGVLGVLLISALIMILLGYLCGLLIKSPWIQKQVRKFESGVLEKIPVYNLAKSLFGTEAGIKSENNFRPALLKDGDAFSLCYVTSESADFYTLYVSEGGLSGGELRIVPKSSVQLLNIRLPEFTRLIKQYGIGSAQYAEQFINSVEKT